MPTYEYKCLKCKKHFDVLQRMSEKPLTRCIHCKGKVERLISAGAGLIFKGSGFYQTDYKNKATPDKSDKSATDKPKEAKSESASPAKSKEVPAKKSPDKSDKK